MSNARETAPPAAVAHRNRGHAAPDRAPGGMRRRMTARKALLLALAASGGCLAVVVSTEIAATASAIPILSAACLAAAASSLAGLYLIHRRERAERQAHADEHLAHGIERLEDLKWELSENELRYRSLLDNQQEVIVRRDRDGCIVFANRAFCRLSGVEPEAVIGSRLALDVIDGDRPAPIAGEAARRRRYTQLVATARGDRWIEWEEQLLAGRDERELEAQAVGRDVTDSRKAEAELAEARDAAMAASRAKSRFLASMSHEIRTPMNGILGMAGLLIDMPQPPEQRTYVQAIDQSARTLLALIDEILDFSKIEAGKLVLQSAPFSLEECVQGCVELLAPKAHGKGLELAWSFDPSIPRLIGDDARVRQILLNLLSNAVKFTDAGGVRVSVERGETRQGDHDAGTAGAGAGVGIRIAVEDTGIGLSPTEAGALFAEFEQADTALKRQQGGTGLGLAISKRLARAMGGEITLSSRLGTGSTFTAELTLQAASGTLASNRSCIRPLGARHVLLAFDRPLERRALAEQIAHDGMAVLETTLAEAVNAADEAAQRGEHVSHVIVDADGDIETAGHLMRRLRRPGYGPEGVVLVSTTSRSNLSGFRAYGFHTYLVRPVRPSAARDFVSAPGNTAAPAAEPLRTLPPPAAEAGAAPRTSYRVLLAEDNEINALLARRVVERAGGEVHWVSNGREAVDAMRSVVAGETPPYDVILMDIFMPEVDGLEATARIKAICGQGAATACPPIVALTANAFPEDRIRYLAAGMDAYLAKPFDKADLEGLLMRVASGTRSGDDAASAA